MTQRQSDIIRAVSFTPEVSGLSVDAHKFDDLIRAATADFTDQIAIFLDGGIICPTSPIG